MLEDAPPPAPAPASPTTSEVSYDSSHTSDYEYGDTTDQEREIEEEGIDTHHDMAKAIAFTYNEDDMEYEADNGRHMFDDGLSDDESVDSDASTNYEELTEPDIITRLIRISDSATSDESVAEDIVEEASEYVCTSEEEDSDELEHTVSAPIEQDATMGDETPAPAPQRRNLSELHKQQTALSRCMENRDRTLWHLKSIQEQIRQLELELPIAEAALEQTEESVEAKQSQNEAELQASGISTELFEAYQDFCESLHPEFGLREGFSIECNAPHNDSYVQYDPEFEIFKDCVEIPYNNCNFRCEASSLRVPEFPSRPLAYRSVAVVEFYPIKCPEGLNGEVTWGELYVSQS
jgi:hypothetical protein